MDIVLIASIMCVFPYMAQIYQYNTAMGTYSLAHLLAAAAVILSTRATVISVTGASLLYTAAFSIYQSVIANAATIFIIWILASSLFSHKDNPYSLKSMLKPSVSDLLSVAAGGLIYLAVVSFMEMKIDSYQAAGDAFSLGSGLDLPAVITGIVKGTRSFFFWPEHYFPDFLKKLQLVFLATAGALCIWIPKSISKKIAAAMIVVDPRG